VSRFEDLTVWRAAKALAVSSYRATDRFPKAEEYGLKSQIRRAAVSVPTNIAEGSGRYSKKDFVRFLRIARGSLSELESLLMVAIELEMLDSASGGALSAQARQVGRMLSGLIRSISGRGSSG
jgi:four helix bundle protein